MRRVVVVEDKSAGESATWVPALEESQFQVDLCSLEEAAGTPPGSCKILVLPVSEPADFEAVNLFGGFPRDWALVLVLCGTGEEIWSRALRERADAVVDARSGAQAVAVEARHGLVLRAETILRILPLEHSLLCPGERGAGENQRFARELVQACFAAGCVTVEAEEGCGGDLLARWVHQMRRKEGPFFALDCRAAPAQSVHSIFLGSAEWGPGLLERLRGGTLLLRNPQALPANTQAALGLCLRNREYMRPGTEERVELDLDVVAVAAVSLADRVSEGAFNRNLAVTLGENFISLPALRERSEEIPALAAQWAAGPSCRCSISPAVLKAMREYLWPGNGWELYNVLEDCFEATGRGGTFQPFHLPPALRKCHVPSPEEEESLYILPRLHPKRRLPRLRNFRDQARVQAERAYLLKVLQQTEGKVAEARQIAGLSKSSFYALLGKHDLLPSKH